MKKVKVKKKRGRPNKGEVRNEKAELRLEKQSTQSCDDSIKELPIGCDIGCKKNAKGVTNYWIGHKLHLSVSDSGIPLAAILTSASVHDSQVAIPLMKLASSRVEYCYDLMDSAYSADKIKDVSKSLGHVAVIDHNKRRGEKIDMDPAKKERYKIRSSVERVNGLLKDHFNGRDIWVKGEKKVMAHLMLGIISITASQLINLV